MNFNITCALITATVLCLLFSQTRKYGVVAVSLLCIAYPRIILSLVIIFSGSYLYKKVFSKWYIHPTLSVPEKLRRRGVKLRQIQGPGHGCPSPGAERCIGGESGAYSENPECRAGECRVRMWDFTHIYEENVGKKLHIWKLEKMSLSICTINS